MISRKEKSTCSLCKVNSGKSIPYFKKKLRREQKTDGIENFIEENNNEQRKVRMKQFELHQNSPFDFVKSLLKSLNSIQLSDIEYLVIWIKLILDEWSRSALPDLYNQYHESWTRIRKTIDEDSRGNVSDLHKLEQELSDASFGLEHILREFGQIYEAAIEAGTQLKETSRNQINQLPGSVAKLLVTGIPFELMDGDAAFVPITWVTAVFAEIQKIIGNKTMFVISVVGIQRSGKSTLLNTMFGLQFAVSAGRCTRGVYCQLIPVNKESTQLKYDYILIVDTEGLRAPELQTANSSRDNELATFVIGLGDLTIVNIKGETVAEIQDVLQIVIHAMLRMKLVNKSSNLKPSCFFVHQNVSAVSAKEKMKFGQEQFYSNLDKMTEHAANQEKIPNYKHFNEVIEFDEQKHIVYLPDLWQGEQPMATVNGAYREKVEELKSLIMDDMKQHSTVLKVDKISSRMKDLWQAILSENFVFSFKNSEELTTFSKLEAFISKMSWDFKNASLELQNRAATEICSCEKNVDASMQQLHMRKIRGVLYEKCESLQTKLQKYFETNDNKEILEQWRFSSEQNLKNMYTGQLARIENDLNGYVRRRAMQLDNGELANSYNSRFFELAEKTANDLRNKSHTTLSEVELEKHFEKAWIDLISKLPKGTDKSDSEVMILGDIKKELFEHFHTNHRLLNRTLESYSLENVDGSTFKQSISVTADDLLYISKDNVLTRLGNWAKMHKNDNYNMICLNTAQLECDNILDKVCKHLRSLSGLDYNPNRACEVMEIMNFFFEQFESKRKEQKFTFKLEFTIRFTVYVCKCAANEFIQMRKCFQKATDPMASVTKNKAMLLKLFKNTYFSIGKEQRVADVFIELV